MARRGRSPKATDEEIAQALRKANGVVTEAAVILGMSREGLARRINRSPELQLIRDDARRRMGKLALKELRKHLKAGEPWAIRYVLARVGYLVGWGLPPVRIMPHDDPTDVLARLDAIEQELVGSEIALKDYLALLELRRLAVADLMRAGDVVAELERIVQEVKRVLERFIADEATRAELLRELALAVRRGAERAQS
jgi:hypothetical protein